MKKNKKKLQKYWIGKRPVDPGYLINKGIGNATFSTTPGQDLSGEARAARLNIIPQTLGKLGQNIQYPIQMLLGVNTIAPGASLMGAAAINKAGGISNLLSKGATPIVKGVDAASGLPTEIGVLAGDKAINTGLNTLGKVAGALGTAYGAYNMYNDIANQGPTLSQSDIANSSSVNTYTTDQGNTYTQHGGIDRSSILDYAKSERTSKLLGFGLDAIGTGLSLGGLIGNVPGMILGGLGGALVGGIGALLGLGDNEDEYKEMMRRQEDVFAMQDRQSEALAKDKDIKTEFYGGLNRVLSAANGKLPCFSIGKSPNARVSNGEGVGVMDNFGRILDIEWIPGKPNNEDNVKIHLPDNKYLHSFVISNKHNLSKKAKINPYAALQELAYLQNTGQMNNRYKNGKLPKYALGLDAISSIAPHAFSMFFNNIPQYNKAKEADTYAPDVYVDNPEGTKAVNTLAQLRFDADPYYREALRGLNWANYNARRNVGLTLGGRAIAQATNYANYLRGLGDITKMYNEALNSYAEKYANALANLGATNQGRRMEAAAKRHAWLQQAQGLKESWIAQYRKNIDQNLLNAAAEYMKWGQYSDSLDIQNKTLGLYLQLVDLDKLKYENSIGTRNYNSADLLKAYDAIRSMQYIPGMGFWKTR